MYNQRVNDSVKKYDEIRKSATDQGNHYTTGCLLDYSYFKNNYHIIHIDTSKRNSLDVDPMATQNFEVNRGLRRN